MRQSATSTELIESGGRPSRIFVLDNDKRFLADMTEIARQIDCEIIGSTSAASPDVSELAEMRAVDAALVNLVASNGGSDQIIRAFQSRDIPVIVRSALMRNAVSRTYPGAEVLETPYCAENLRSALLRVLKKSDTPS